MTWAHRQKDPARLKKEIALVGTKSTGGGVRMVLTDKKQGDGGGAMLFNVDELEKGNSSTDPCLAFFDLCLLS